MLKNKTILLGVTGSIAAYKAAALASSLVKLHGDVHVIMTENATQFISPITFETLTGNKCLVDTFDRNFEFQVEHVSLAKRAQMVMVAPATANVIGKLAHGIADDMLTTTILATKAPVYVAPAMNTNMLENPVVQENLDKLRCIGYTIIPSASGRLACGDVGNGKMPEPEDLLWYILRKIGYPKDFAGKKVLVTAGPTQEPLDPVRFLTNHSSGKMGYAIARNAMLRGAEVTLITGKTNLTPPPFVRVVSVQTADEMYQAVMQDASKQDAIFMAAAVADYRPENVSAHKMKKADDALFIPLERTKDILAELGKQKSPEQFLCGFCMETQNTLEFAAEKRKKKNLDLICANNLLEAGAGFEVDTNVVTLITEHETTPLPLLSKDAVAEKILDYTAKFMSAGNA